MEYASRNGNNILYIVFRQNFEWEQDYQQFLRHRRNINYRTGNINDKHPNPQLVLEYKLPTEIFCKGENTFHGTGWPRRRTLRPQEVKFVNTDVKFIKMMAALRKCRERKCSKQNKTPLMLLNSPCRNASIWKG